MACICIVLLLSFIASSNCLNIARYSESPVQYHIQTDDGYGRYFRFQTYNGQWRKEKRLESGKVIGAYGWTDDLGVLRLYDYLADENGYRIVRERNIKVNKNNKLLQQLQNQVRTFRPTKVIRKNTFKKARKQLKKPPPNSIRGKTGMSNRRNTDKLMSNSRKTEELMSNDISDTNRGKELGSDSGKTVRIGRQLNRGKKLRVINKQFKNQSPKEEEKQLKLGSVRPRISMSRQLRAKLNKKKKKDKTYKVEEKVQSKNKEIFGRSLREEGSGKELPEEGSERGSSKVPSSLTNSLTQSTGGVTKEITNSVRKKRRPEEYGTNVESENSRTIIDFDTGNQFRYEVMREDGARVGRHGYVDPMGFLRVTNYVTSATGGHTEQRTSEFLGSRRVGGTDYRCTPTCL